MNRAAAVISSILITVSVCSGMNLRPYAASTEEDPVSWSDPDELSGEKDGAGAAALPEDAQILKEDENLLIAVTGYEPEDLWGYTLDLYLENRTDRELAFVIYSCCINGCMMDPYYQTVIKPGQSENADVEWFQSALDEAGITDVTQIELDWLVYDYQNWEADFLLHESYCLYPEGEEAFQPEAREPLDTDRVLVDNEECTIIATKSDMNELWGFELHLYILNKSGHEITVGIEESLINGVPCDPYWGVLVNAERAAYETVTWSNTFLKESGIQAVKSMEIPFYVMNSSDYSLEPVRETVLYEP